MQLVAFVRYTTQIGKSAPDDFERVVGLGGRSADVAVFCVNTGAILMVCGAAAPLAIGSRWSGGWGVLAVVIACVTLVPLIQLVRTSAFWILRRAYVTRRLPPASPEAT